jgi:uncharacterized LabA/DUF88 family protein
MNLQKTLFFLDFANINRAASDHGIRMEYSHLKSYMGFGRELLDAYCYVPIDPRNEHRFDRDIEELQKAGYLVTTKVGTYAGDSYKCDFDVEMTIDIIRMAHLIRPEIIVVGTGDSDFIPVVTELRKMGIRVEIAAFNSSMSKKLKLNSSGFIDLDSYVTEAINEQSSETILGHGESAETFSIATFALGNEELQIASEIMQDENLAVYVFQQKPEFTMVKEGSSEAVEFGQAGIEVINEYQNELGAYLIYKTI